MSSIAFGRPFVLRRDRDISDVSGTGIVADGIQFPDGHAAIHWRGRWPLTTPHPDGIDSIMAIHDHGGRGDLHIIWADEAEETRRKLAADIIDAFDVPPEVCGTQAELAYRRRQVEQAIHQGAEEARQCWDRRVWDIKGTLAGLADATMPVISELVEQRNRANRAAGRAYLLADRWQAAEGPGATLVRAAGAELRDVLDDSEAFDAQDVHSQGSAHVSELAGVDESALECVCGDPVQWMEHLDDPGWIHSPGSDTTCTHARPRCPECQMPHLLVPGQPPMCRPMRAYLSGAHRVASVECSAQYRGLSSGPRQCIRAAQHRGDHVDDYGFHWSDTVAVYPVVDGEPQYSRAMARCSNPDHACASCGNCVNEHPGDGGCEEKTPDIRADKSGATVLNHQVNKGEEPDNEPDTVIDPELLRRQYREAFREVLGVGPWAVDAHRVADAVMRVRDGETDRLRQRLTLADQVHRTDLGSSDRQACPYCTGAPQFLRSELPGHVQASHGRILAALARGVSLDELLHETEA